MSGWADFDMSEARRRELLREAEERRLARGLREARKAGSGELPLGRWGRISALFGSVPVPFHRAFRG